MKIIQYKRIVIILLIIIILLLLLFYLFDVKNTRVQPHLYSIYENSVQLHRSYPSFLNKSPKITYQNGVCIVQNILNPYFFKYLKNQFNNKTFQSKDIYFRKATGIHFFDLHGNEEYNGFLELYYSNELAEFLSHILKKPIQKPPLNDPNACSLLIYTQSGDFIDWHKDYSLYNGDRFVVLFTIINENEKRNGLSQNEFIYKYNGIDYPIKLQENSIVIFKGSEVLHKSTAIGENERRILLSTTFCDVCQEKKNILQYMYEKVKNSVIYK